jgi:prevent-host-death family protein
MPPSRDTWQLQRAKAELSKLIDRSIQRGPQTVTRHGKPAVVVVAVEDWRRLTGRRSDFKKFLRSAPLDGLELERDPDSGRPVDL